MLREVIKQIIVNNQERILKLQVNNRDIRIEEKANYVFTGPRRAGKTYFLYQYIQKYYGGNKIEKVLYINFEDERLIELNHTNINTIIESYYEIYSYKPVLFFDEIQNIKYWEKFVRRLADENYKILITGSNSNMLSSQIASVLGGRFLIKDIYPLSFKEYLEFNDIHFNKKMIYSNKNREVKRLFFKYFKYGGFPEIIKYEDKLNYLSNLFQKLFYGDIIARYNVHNDLGLKYLIKKLADSVNNETSINRIKNLIKSLQIPIGVSTIYEYLNYLEEAFIIFPLKNSKYKFKDRESKKKYYFVDNGLLSIFLFDQDTKLLENLVFLHLKRNYSEFYYYKKELEVDFYIPEKNILIQVSYDISDNETEKREIKAIEKAAKELACENAMIITLDNEKQINTNKMPIPVVPVWKWLLSD